MPFASMEANVPVLDFRKFNKYRQEMWREAWERAIRNFLTTMLSKVPTLHGGTKRAFEEVASTFGAEFENDINTSYVVWEGWEDNHFKEYSQVSWVFEFESRGTEVTFEITGFPDTFTWNNSAGTGYVQYWRRGTPPWANRKSHAPQGEPWLALTEATNTMKSELVAASKEIIPAAFRKAMTIKKSFRN